LRLGHGCRPEEAGELARGRDDGDVAGFLRAFRQAGLQLELAASRRYLNETLLAYRLSPGERR